MASSHSPRFDQDNTTTKPELGPGASTEPKLTPDTTTESPLAEAITIGPNTKNSLLIELIKKVQSSQYTTPPLDRLIQIIKQQSESQGLLMQIFQDNERYQGRCMYRI